MSERDQMLYLTDIVESITAIQSFVVDCEFAQFCNDRKTFSATIRELEIIGEAINNVSDEIKTQYPAVLWRKVMSLGSGLEDSKLVWIPRGPARNRRFLHQGNPEDRRQHRPQRKDPQLGEKSSARPT